MKTGKDFFIDTDVSIKCKDTSVFGNHSAVDKGFYCTKRYFSAPDGSRILD